MFAPKGGYTSASANTDDHGFRVAVKGGHLMSLRKIKAQPFVKGAVLGNSQIWGTGASADANVFHNIMNSERADEIWYSFALRASSLTQERLAAALFAPLDATHVVWITGGIFLNYATSGMAHDKVLPFPFYGRFMTLMGGSDRGIQTSLGLEQIWPQAMALFEREIILYSRLFRATARNLIFALQPTLSWSNKRLAPEEEQLWTLFQSQIDRSAMDPAAYRVVASNFARQADVICRRHRVTFLNVAEHPEFQGPEWLYIDGAHMTDAGHRALGRVISRYLR
jgi:hypothetical protein